MKIDPDANVMDMLRAWENGNRNDVIKTLADDHPGLTAMFLVTGIGEKMLSRVDANYITNTLMDKRVALAQSL